MNGCISALSDALLRRPKYTAGGWVWIYNTPATIRQGLRKGADNKVLKENLLLNWTGPLKILAGGPSSAADTPDGRPLGDKLLYLDLPSNLSGPAAKPRVTVARCKPCANPYYADDIPRHLPAGLTQYVLHAFATKMPMSTPKSSTSETKTPISTSKTSTSETKTPISTPKTSTSETKTPAYIYAQDNYIYAGDEYVYWGFGLRRFCSLSLCPAFAVSTHAVFLSRTNSSVYCNLSLNE